MALFGMNSHTRLLVDQLHACRQSFFSGQIAFFGSRVDRHSNAPRFWIEWTVQAFLLTTPFIAIVAVALLGLLFGF